MQTVRHTKAAFTLDRDHNQIAVAPHVAAAAEPPRYKTISQLAKGIDSIFSTTISTAQARYIGVCAVFLRAGPQPSFEMIAAAETKSRITSA